MRPSRTSSLPPSTRSGYCSRYRGTSRRRTPRCRRAAGSARSGAASSLQTRRSGCSASAASANRSPAARSPSQMRVVAYDPFVSRSASASSASRARTDRRGARRADFMTLHLPLTDETRGAIDADALAMMRDGARIVNAARGELVDEAALVAALESGKVAGAAIDVFSAEPYGGPLLERAEHHRHAAPRRVDRRGAGPRRRRRGRAGVAALDGGLVTNAVNIPTVGAEDLEVLGPFVPLAAKLGRLAMELAGGASRRSRSRSTASSPSTTPACSPSPRSTAPSRAAPTSR